jgi:hypothetical protein
LGEEAAGGEEVVQGRELAVSLDFGLGGGGHRLG